MVRIGKVESQGRPARSGPSFRKVQITGLPEGSTLLITTNNPVIDDFACLLILLNRSLPLLEIFFMFA